MSVDILKGHCLKVLPALTEQSVNCCVTSPPYWGLRDYGVEGQLGLESTPEEYVAKIVAVFREVKRVLRDDGTLWLNLGDSYNGSGGIGGTGKQHTSYGSVTRQDNRAGWSGLKPKDLVGIPWRVAFALQADGWYLRQDIIWAKPNPMPESVTDRCTKSHEYIFLLSKSKAYHYDHEAIKELIIIPIDTKAAQSFKAEGGKARENYGTNEDKWEPDGTRNKRSVWTVNTKPYKGVHFATFPPELIRPCILAGCPAKGTVLDPFGGSGTTGEVAEMEGRNSILIELNPEYVALARKRTAQMGLFA